MQEGIRSAGVLLHEGVSGGHAPTVEVLSVGSTGTIRQPSDLLPYLPKLRQHFVALPQTTAEMGLRSLKVPINEIEAVTKLILKVRGLTWTLKARKGILTLAADQFTRDTET